jgi:hypothetical protein
VNSASTTSTPVARLLTPIKRPLTPIKQIFTPIKHISASTSPRRINTPVKVIPKKQVQIPKLNDEIALITTYEPDTIEVKPIITTYEPSNYKVRSVEKHNISFDETKTESEMT